MDLVDCKCQFFTAKIHKHNCSTCENLLLCEKPVKILMCFKGQLDSNVAVGNQLVFFLLIKCDYYT